MRFNILNKRKNQALNFEGAVAYTLTPEMALYTAVVTTALENHFYEQNDERLLRIRSLIAQVSPEFVARLAIYAREQMHLRTISVVLIVELAKVHQGNQLVSQTLRRVVKRADEITETLAYYAVTNERTQVKKLHKLSKQIQKGLAEAFNQFDEYQFAKYNRAGAVTLRDALFLVHPKAKDEAQQALFNKIVENRLATPYTWETELSAVGQTVFASEKAKKEAFRETWENLISSNRLGYMALLRNLRNILEAEVHVEAMNKAIDIICDKNAVLKSKQLPFRYLSAYRELNNNAVNRVGFVGFGQKAKVSKDVNRLLNALETAVLHSTEQLKGFDATTRVVLACDVSGSMQRSISKNSTVQCYDIGLMLAMMLQAKCENVVAGMFGSHWKTLSLSTRNILANVGEFHRREGEVGYATNGYLVIEDLIKRKHVADKVMMFTDCQMWDTSGTNGIFQSTWLRYKAQVAPNAKLYLFDLVGYGNTPIRLKSNDVFLIAGWSEKVFEVLEAIEKGENALTMIQSIAL